MSRLSFQTKYTAYALHAFTPIRAYKLVGFLFAFINSNHPIKDLARPLIKSYSRPIRFTFPN